MCTDKKQCISTHSLVTHSSVAAEHWPLTQPTHWSRTHESILFPVMHFTGKHPGDIGCPPKALQTQRLPACLQVSQDIISLMCC